MSTMFLASKVFVILSSSYSDILFLSILFLEAQELKIRTNMNWITDFINVLQRLGYGLLRKTSQGLFRSSRKIAKRREFSVENSAAMNYSRCCATFLIYFLI